MRARLGGVVVRVGPGRELIVADTALLVGATGLVGGECLKLLLDHPGYDRVVVLTRRPLEVDHPKLEASVVSFDDLESHRDLIRADHVFCALGSTIKKAGSQERFRTIDHDYPLALARIAREQGATHFSLVTALGADSGSRIFYNRVKGEIEEDVRGLRYPSLTILRPSVIGGERNERRLGESLGKAFGSLLPGRIHTVQAADIARVMVLLAREQEQEWRVIESEQIRRMART
jgi:uncharacterized protein YbjT (DUF2867 family)